MTFPGEKNWLNTELATNVLRCPFCRQKLQYASNIFTCQTHGQFTVANGIPVFSPQDSFDSHWREHGDESLPDSKLAEARAFLAPLYKNMHPDKPFRLLDAGCGNGVHIAAVPSVSLPRESLAMGLDISLPALESASRLDPGWLLVQGDILHPPLTKQYFDAIISFGVLAYTADPPQAVASLAALLIPGGVLGVWIAPAEQGILGSLFKGVRRFCQMTGRPGTWLLAHAMVPFLSFLPTRSKVSLANASWWQCHEVVMVNLAPKNLVFPQLREVAQWFRAAGLQIIVDDQEIPITLWGQKDGKSDAT